MGNPDVKKQATEILFSCKISNQIHPNLYFDGNKVVRYNYQKHLGLTLETNLSFKQHILDKINTAKKCIIMIRRLSNYFPLKTLSNMYKLLVRSHFDYCDIIFHIPPTHSQNGMILHGLMENLEKIQYQAALAITGAWQGSNRVKLYEELGWESLSDRRWSRRILHIHKIVNDKTPSYLKERLPRLRRPLYRQYSTSMIYEIKCRTERYKNSFFPNAIYSWNIAIEQFQTMPSFYTLKNFITKLIRPSEKSTFGIYDILGIKYLFQLRLNLSPLRYHKWKHNFNDITSNKCLCDENVENTEHFLFYCSLFSSQRQILMANVRLILEKYGLGDKTHDLHLYLYGDSYINHVDNKSILLCTINYIKSTKRFSNHLYESYN